MSHFKGKNKFSRSRYPLNRAATTPSVKKIGGSPRWGSRSPSYLHHNVGKNQKSPYGVNKAMGSSPLMLAHEHDEEDEETLREMYQQEQMLSTMASLEPVNVCTQQHVPAHATFSLTQITSLLQYVAPGSIVAFDIDDTLVKRKFSQCALLTQQGTTEFHSYLQTHCNHLSFDVKQSLVNQLGEYLKAFDLAENETAMVVKALQQRGCYVIGLTARSSTMSRATNTCLDSLGIEFSSSAPPTLPRMAIESSTGAACIDGIIYCNDVPKGTVFQRLINLQWLSWPVLDSCNAQCANNKHRGGNGACPHHCKTRIVSNTAERPCHSGDQPCPERSFWFVDDNYPVITTMLSAWQSMANTQVNGLNQLGGTWSQKLPCRGKLSLVCCHYTHPTNYSQLHQVNVQQGTAAQASGIAPHHLKCTPEETKQCIQLQTQLFVNEQRLVSDREALEMIKRQNQNQQQQHQQQTPVITVTTSTSTSSSTATA